MNNNGSAEGDSTPDVALVTRMVPGFDLAPELALTNFVMEVRDLRQERGQLLVDIGREDGDVDDIFGVAILVDRLPGGSDTQCVQVTHQGSGLDLKIFRHGDKLVLRAGPGSMIRVSDVADGSTGCVLSGAASQDAHAIGRASFDPQGAEQAGTQPSESNTDKGDDRQQLLYLLQGLADLGLGTDCEIQGADFLEQVSCLYQGLIDGAAGPRYEPNVIYSPGEAAFWSNSNGWTTFEEATHFFVLPMSLPTTEYHDAALISLSDAKAINEGLF